MDALHRRPRLQRPPQPQQGQLAGSPSPASTSTSPLSRKTRSSRPTSRAQRQTRHRHRQLVAASPPPSASPARRISTPPACASEVQAARLRSPGTTAIELMHQFGDRTAVFPATAHRPRRARRPAPRSGRLRRRRCRAATPGPSMPGSRASACSTAMPRATRTPTDGSSETFQNLFRHEPTSTTATWT